MSYLRYAARMYNCPLLVTSEKARIIEQVVRAHEEGRASLLSPPSGWVQKDKEIAVAAARLPKRELLAPGVARADAGYLRTASGIAIVEMIGTFVQRSGDEQLDAMSGLVAYGSLSRQMMAAADDPRVDGILMYVDSNGGEVPGILDFVSAIDAAKMKKPVWAIADEKALSAGMWVASAADQFFVPPTGLVGSIGVRMLHVDQSQRDAKQGLVYTEIVAGKRKADFSPHAPLSEAALQFAQADLDRIYGMFVDAVASHRGIDPQVVRDTEAGLLIPEQAMALGLIDGIQGIDATLNALSLEAAHFRVYGPRARAQLSQGASTMNPKDDKPAAGAATADQLAEAQTRGFTEGKTEGARIGAEAERARIAGILTHAEAADRRTLAEHLAFKTDNTVDQAAGLLAAAPKAAATPTNLLAAEMAKIDNPNVGADAADLDETAAAVARIMGAGKAPKLAAVK